MFRLLCCGTWCFLAFFVNNLILGAIHDVAGRDAVADLVFAFVPEQEWGWLAGDICSNVMWIFLIFLLIIHPWRCTILKRVLFIIGFLYHLRAICLCLTQLPNGFTETDRICELPLQEFNVGEMITRAFASTLPFYNGGFKRKICGDMFFSGHTLSMITISLTVSHYLPRRFWYVDWCAKTVAYFGAISMIISRAHYTVDVVAAVVLTVGFFSMYHTFCEVPLSNRCKSIYRGTWLYWIFAWLETDVPEGNFSSFQKNGANNLKESLEV